MKSSHTNEGTLKSRRQATQVQVQERHPVDAAELPSTGGAPQNGFDGTGLDKSGDADERRIASTSALAVMLGQLVGYFSGRANIDDIDVFSFSLHHLFCRVDFLYRQALPHLTKCSAPILAGEVPEDDVRPRMDIWSQLQAINRALDRMEPLCHLLSDATECILDSFDITSEKIHTSGSTVEMPVEAEAYFDEGPLMLIEQTHWEQAFRTLTESLGDWQANQEQLVPFCEQFSSLIAPIPSLERLDAAFATLLDSAGTIFGDILPAFRAIAVGDDVAIAALLFDLMQQSDALLVQFETTLEPMNGLIKQFGPGAEIICS